MLFLVYEECTYRQGNHLVDCTNCRLEWLATVRLFAQKGQVASHFDFKDGPGGATVYRVESRDDLDSLLAQHPTLDCQMERRIHELQNLDEAQERLSHQIVSG